MSALVRIQTRMKLVAQILIGLAAGVCASTASAATTYAYDALGRLASVVYGNGTTISYTYDAAGNRTAKGVIVAPTIVALSGTPQIAVVSTAFGQPLKVKVADGVGTPTAGATVTFAPPASGASANCSAASPTDASGVTQTSCTANGVTGSYVVNATVAGVPAPAVFALTNYAGAAGTPTQVGASMSPAIFTTTITLTATIGGTSPTGTVGFMLGGVAIPGCEAQPITAGQATCQTSALVLGANSVTAAYSGDGQNAAGTSAIVTVPVYTLLDADANTVDDALTDGLLIIRHMFGLSGAGLTNGAVGPNATRSTPASVAAYIVAAGLLLDVDGNNQVDALTDGLIIIRYLFGLRGNALIQGAIGPGATRSTATQIENYLGGFLPQ
jgi:YD repeat-containing protein